MIHTRDADFTLYQGDVLEELASLPGGSVHCVVTSPPYWGLRDYGTGLWDGGDPDCDHRYDTEHQKQGATSLRQGRSNVEAQRNENFRDNCGKCGARRQDRQLGLEPAPDEYVARIVEVFREVRRVLRSDGTCWVNLGDSYTGGGNGDTRTGFNARYFNKPDWNDGKQSGHGKARAEVRLDKPERDIRLCEAAGSHGQPPHGAHGPARLKPKDLVGIPWRVAFALQAAGWYLRADIIWAKPNPMPESVTDRPTKAHEYVFLLTKSPRYYFDQEAVREAYTDVGFDPRGFRIESERYTNQTTAQSNHTRTARGPDGRHITKVVGADGSIQHRAGERWPNPTGRNVRSVWEIATQPYPEAHFATYPEELVRRCILAGTSERGCCPVCGKPWAREVEHESSQRQRYWSGENRGNGVVSGGGHVGRYGAFESNVTTLGWRSGCAHDAAPIPCTVLDPFLGSGTTAYVARKHGRRSIGIELNPDYCELAARRMQQQSLFAEPLQQSLFAEV